MPLWRRVLIAAGNFGMQKRRRLRRQPGARMANAMFTSLAWFLNLIWKVIMWAIYWAFLFDPATHDRVTRNRRTEVKASSLRKTKAWQNEFGKVRAQFIKICEDTLGAHNLYCMICESPFPERAPRGIHVDHRIAVAINPDLSFDHRNFQPCCKHCNMLKSDDEQRVDDRRPRELVMAAERAYRAYLKTNGGVDPIHKITRDFEGRNRKKTPLVLMLFGRMGSHGH
jgi:hypothetical protein